MKKYIVITILLLSPIICNGEEKYFVIPPKSPLKYSHYVKDQLEDHFTGTVTLSGKMVFQPNSDMEEILVQFDLDDASSRKLPYINKLGPVKTVGIAENRETYINRLSDDQKKKLLAGSSPSIEYLTTIVATDYLAEVSCDHTNFWVKIVRVVSSKLIHNPVKMKAGEKPC